MKYIKIITLSLSLVILSAMAFVRVASAQTFKAGDTITVPANETVNSMLFAGGNNIDILLPSRSINHENTVVYDRRVLTG